MTLPARSESALRQRQRKGQLRVRAAADFRRLVAEAGLAEAYAATDVVVAADAEFTDQGSLHLSIGPSDPPIRFREAQLEGMGAQSSGGGDLVLPIGGGLGEAQRQGGAQLLDRLLRGEPLALAATGEVTALQPRRDLQARLDLERIGSGRLVLHRAITENGVVAVSSGEGVLRSPWGPVLGPFGNALYGCGGAGSIGLTMPGLSLLGPGSPLLVGGSIGWVIGSGSGHQPGVPRSAGGHALSPGAVAAVSVDLHGLRPEWLRPCFFEGHGAALLVGVAAPIPLINAGVAAQAACGDGDLEAPVLDVAIPRRIRPRFGSVSYARLKSGAIRVEGHRVSAAPAHSPRLAEAIGQELITWLEEDRFPLRLPLRPLSGRTGLIPLDS
ncbi:homocysteine biosynthesis protein [Synechococcus sp. CCY 9618]|uniref:homocysteine biosynthesis protein n=1 Tax=Synechococcus sp. CCY 9618 TaxID=2815602 RepID=UPI001C21A58C|nr:homocysteine biosynthesis protein [Synechococcus sp. CCY 9618]